MTKLYSLIWGQCTEALQAALKGIDDFQVKDDAFDAKWLLENIKSLSSGIKQAMVNICNLAHRAGRQFFNFIQKEDESCESFMTCFNDFVMNLELAKIIVVKHTIIKDTYIDSKPTLNVMVCEKTAKEAAVESLRLLLSYYLLI